MRRVCEACGEEYDDLYRLTYCPHESFEMNTVVCDRDGVVGVAHTVEDLRRMAGWDGRRRRLEAKR